MKAKEYLSEARRAAWVIEAKQSELAELEKTLHNAYVQEVKVKTTAANDRMKMVDTIVDLQAEIRREIANLITIKKEIHGKINQLSKSIYIGILTEYYINNKPWRQISAELHISERHLYRIHGNALTEFRKKFGMN